MRRHRLFEEDLTRSVIGAFYTVYNSLGYGFLERLYAAALERELRRRGHDVGREVPVEVLYEGGVLGIQRLDMVVDRKLVIEVKSTELLHPMARRQLFNYLKSTHLEIGLLLHFGPQPKFYRLLNVNLDRS
jgi:GxxExxY protein